MRAPLLLVATAFALGIFLGETLRPGFVISIGGLACTSFILAVCLHRGSRVFDDHYETCDLMMVVALITLVILSGALRREVQVCSHARAPGRGAGRTAAGYATGDLVVAPTPPGSRATGFTPGGIVLRLKGTILDIHRATLSPRHAALLAGFLFGEKDTDEELKEDFRLCGVVHLLSASGLHVGFVAMLLSGLTTAIGLTGYISAAITIAGVLIYVVMAGMRAPVMRAGIMFTAARLARCMGRDVDGRNLLGLAGLALLAWDPSLLFDTGFQLSFMATLGILEFTPRLLALGNALVDMLPGKRVEGTVRGAGVRSGPPGVIGRWLVEPVAVTMAAQAGVLPLLAYHFNEVSLIGIVANPIMVPLAEVSVIIGFISGLAGLALPVATEVFNAANAVILEAIIIGARVLSRIPFASVALPCQNLAAMALYYCIAPLIFYFLTPPGPWKAGRLKRIARKLGEWWQWHDPGDKIIIGVALATAFIILLALKPGAPLKVTFIAVGQGDAALIRTPGGRAILLDGGSSYGRRGAVMATLRRRVRRLDAIIISHPHEDHIGGLKDVIIKMKVGGIIDVGLEHPSPVYEKLLGLIRERSIPYLIARRGFTLRPDRHVTLDVLHPGPLLAGTRDDINNNSLVVRLSYRNVRFLFTGDIEIEGQRELVAECKEGGVEAEALRSTVLKVPHHGSRYSLDRLFLGCVDPKVAVISVGRNRFGHPDARVLERLASGGSVVYRTDESGSITVVTDGQDIRVMETRRLSSGEFAR
ncbi:MAG TPA: DNA internalization-related competence protein ComEC/Rec2 [Firmicutes bacterium]|nr:DNA internalization-related competence protein ComEC/Rec2 [Bacillota bacterium]